MALARKRSSPRLADGAVRNRTFILVAGFLLVLFVGAGALYVYDSSREDIVAEGVSVTGIDLGGLSSEEARD